jgi:hypothetical protein
MCGRNTWSPAKSGGPLNTIPSVGLPAWGIRGAWLPVFPRVQPSRLRRLEEHILEPPRKRTRSRLLGRLSCLWNQQAGRNALEATQTLIAAHGRVLALLAVLLARQDVIGCEEFADTLAGLAGVTLPEYPDEAVLLEKWASVVKDAAGTISDVPVRH